MSRTSLKKLLSAMLSFVFCISVIAFTPISAEAVYDAFFLDGTVAKEATFILDPGHGGIDSGALGPADSNGYQREEADANLSMAFKVAAELERQGYTVALTRLEDTTVALIDRSHIANDGNYKIFCSLHRNSDETGRARGIGTFYYDGLTENSPSAKIAAKLHETLLTASPEMTNRGVKCANFSVLRETFTNAVLIESLFISNVEDNILYDKIESDLAVAIANGLIASLPLAAPDYLLSNTYPTEDLGDSFVAALTIPHLNIALTNDGNNNVCATPIDYSDSQLWKFEKLDWRNTYKITSVLDGKCLDINGAGKDNLTNVMVWDDNGERCQKYYFYSIYEKHVIRPMHCTNDRVIDINAVNYNAQIYDFIQTNPNQQFVIVKEEEFNKNDESSEENCESSEENCESSQEPDVSQGSKLELAEDSPYTLENNIVSNVVADTTAESFASNFTNEVAITTANGEAIEASKIIGTGYIVTDIVSGESAEIMILGDVNGDGELSATDYIQIKSFFLSGQGLDGIYFTAANIDGEDEIDGTDYIKLKSHFLGQSNIYA